MKIGMVGLGRMGANMTRRLLRGGHECVAFDLNPFSVSELVKEGAQSATSLEDLAGKLPKPRAVWVMLPAGAVTEETVTTLGNLLAEGDVVIDGGNTFFKDDVRRARGLAARQMHYVDVGTSGVRAVAV